MDADPWVRELTRASEIASTYHTPLTEVLGRPLTAVDVEGLDTMIRAKADAWTSDEKIREMERAAAQKPPG